jgi:chromosome partitioning protein
VDFPWVISFVGKGGSAKSTSAVFVATIAALLGHSVWVLDLDPQASATMWGSRRTHSGLNNLAQVEVHKCHSRQIRKAIDAARLRGIRLVIIDNQPRRHEDAIDIAGSAHLSVVTSGPTPFDVEETKAWLDFLTQHHSRHCIVLGNAPAKRDDVESPLVARARNDLVNHTQQIARGRLAAPLWTGQVSRRHSVIWAVMKGCASVETEPAGASAAEFRRLWVFLMNQLAGVNR